MNLVANAIHSTLSPDIIFKGTKLDVMHQKPLPFGTYISLDFTEKNSYKKQQYHTENGILLRLVDDSTSNIIA